MPKFAVIETGGKQYKVSPGQKLRVEKLAAVEGSNVVFPNVLLTADLPAGRQAAEVVVKVGTPYIEGAKVEARVLRQGRDKKKIIFKYHPKTRYRKKKGHRQPFTEVEIVKV